MPPIRLNIGSGPGQIPGFTPIDKQLGHDATKLDYADGTVDEVYASHVLEHIHHSKTLTTIKEWVRVLKPGGRLRIAVPNIEQVIKKFQAGDIPPELLSMWLHGTADVDHDRHQAEFTYAYLEQIFRRLGLTRVGKWDAEYKDCSALPDSLNVEGYKRVITVPAKPRVVMALSTPRFGPIDFYSGVIETARELGWQFMEHGGTEWGRGLTQAIVKSIKQYDPDYIMCLDYDSVFTADDCRKLLQIMQENPEIGAAYPVEAHRHQDCPLGYDTGRVPQLDYTGPLTDVPSGHFGCTIIRRQVFEDLEHPWFMSLPNPVTGLWADALDADLHFWAKMQVNGWRTVQANEIQIGHMEFCIKWIVDGGIAWQPIQHYRRHGPLKDAKFNGKYWTERNAPKAAKPVELSKERVDHTKFPPTSGIIPLT